VVDAVPGGGAAVGPHLGTGGEQEQPAPGEVVAQLVDVELRLLERRGDQRGRDLGADHARGLERALLRRREPISSSCVTSRRGFASK